MIFFKVKYLLIWILVALSIIGLTVVLYIRFDEQNQIPFYILAIPISCLLFAFILYQICEITLSKDYNYKILNCYDQKWKLIFTAISSCSTIVYIITLISSLYLVQYE